MTQVQNIIESIRSLNPNLIDEIYEEIKRQKETKAKEAA